MNVKKIGLSWITVSDLVKARSFFVETLGLEVKDFAPEWGWMECSGKEGDSLLGVGQAQGEMKAGHNAVMTFTVDDVVAGRAELLEKGVRIIDEIVEVPGHVKMLTFFDNDGNMFQLCQRLDNE